jgi:hypothetical protein
LGGVNGGGKGTSATRYQRSGGKKEDNAETTEFAEKRAKAADRKNPPFAEKREEWGTLKYVG